MSALHSFRALVLLVLAGLTVARSAGAQSRARDLFQEGRAAAERGDWVGACAKFDESLSHESSVGALVNLGECNEHQGKLATALTYWRSGLARMAKDDARRDLATRSIAELEGRTPKIVVRVPGKARVFIDGQAAAPGEPWPVDLGAHKVVVLGEGPARTFDVTVREGEVLPLDVPGAPRPSVVAHSPRATRSAPVVVKRDNPLLVPAMIGFGVAGAGLVAFGVTGALFLGERSVVQGECDERNRCTDRGLAAGERAVRYGIVNAVSLGIAALGAGTGTALLIVGGPAAPASAEARVRGTSLEFTGRF